MKNIILVAFFISFIGLACSQTHCYSTFQYTVITANSSGVREEVKHDYLSMCYNNAHFSIHNENSLMIFKIYLGFIDQRRGTAGERILNFSNDANDYHRAMEWRVEVSKDKKQTIVLNNTLSGKAYLMEFEGDYYDRIIKNVDSLAKADSLKEVMLKGYYPIHLTCKACGSSKRFNKMPSGNVYCNECETKIK